MTDLITVRLPGTRSLHQYVPVSESIMQYYVTCKLEYDDLKVKQAATLTLRKSDIIACVYDKQWWLGVSDDINLMNKDVYVHFYHPCGPRTSFKVSYVDKAWVSVTNVLRKLSPLEMSTLTEHLHNISETLCEEISGLLNRHT